MDGNGTIAENDPFAKGLEPPGPESLVLYDNVVSMRGAVEFQGWSIHVHGSGERRDPVDTMTLTHAEAADHRGHTLTENWKKERADIV